MNTSELMGEDLEHAVECSLGNKTLSDMGGPRPFISDWALAGPLIERHKIAIMPGYRKNGGWLAMTEVEWIEYEGPIGKFEHMGPTPLIAAMRCLVDAISNKSGD